MHPWCTEALQSAHDERRQLILSFALTAPCSVPASETSDERELPHPPALTQSHHCYWASTTYAATVWQTAAAFARLAAGLVLAGNMQFNVYTASRLRISLAASRRRHRSACFTQNIQSSAPRSLNLAAAAASVASPSGATASSSAVVVVVCMLAHQRCAHYEIGAQKRRVYGKRPGVPCAMEAPIDAGVALLI